MSIRKRANISILLATIFCFLAACSGPPKNIGIAASGSEIGETYEGKLSGIYPVFVDLALERDYSAGSGAVLEAMALRLLQNNDYAAQYALGANGLASTATGIYEDRYAGAFCQYFLEVNDQDLLDSLSGDFFDVDEDDNLVQQQVYDLGFRIEDTENEISDLALQLEDSTDNAVRVRTQALIDRLQDRIAGYNSRMDTLLGVDSSDEDIEASTIFVVNPCRDFKVGSTVIISKNVNTVILQPTFSPLVGQ